ncbi:MAG: TonB-dependent receptor, partial [Bacteroidota bacterium]
KIMKQKFSYFIVLFGLILLSGFNSYGQNTSIKVLNADTEKAVPYAEIVLNKPDGSFFKGMTTDNNGVADFNLNQTYNYQVLFLGYETREGQISPGEHLTIELIEEYDMLDDVVVTGQYTPQKADKSIYKIDVVDSRQMEQRGVNNLADALSLESNINIRSDPTTGTSIEIQGMSDEQVKYLIDGIPIVGRVDGRVDLSQINMDNVDHVEIVQGPMSVVYGSNAIAGVINIITKKNKTNKNIAKVNGYIDNNENYNFGFYGSIIRGKHTISTSGSRNMFRGIDQNMDLHGNIDAVDNRYQEFKPKLVYNGDLEYAFTNKDFRFSAKSSIMHSELRFYSNPNPNTMVASDRYFNTLRNINSIAVSDKLTESLSYNIIGSYTFFNRDDERIMSDLTDLTQTHTGTTSTKFNNLMTRGNFTWMPEDSKLNFQFGWDVNHETAEGERIEGGEKTMTDYAAFASAQWMPFKKLTLQPGIRFMHNTEYDAPIAPSINFQWSIIDNLSMRLSYAKGFRAPSLKQLYLSFHDSNHDLEGNPDLKAETTDSYNGSLTYKIKGENYLMKFEPSAYFNDAEQRIELHVPDPENNPNYAKYVNLKNSRYLGSNFMISFAHNNGLKLSTGFSLSGESLTDKGSSIDMDEYEFYNIVTFNARYQYKPWNLTGSAIFKYYDDRPNLADYGYAVLYTETQSYSDFEITLSKNFLDNRLNIVVGGKNLFDNYTLEIDGGTVFDGSSYQPMYYGRTYFAKAIFKLTK